MMSKKILAKWRVNTGSLLSEILVNNETRMLEKPIKIFSSLLKEVADRCIEIDDPQLNALMCRLALYTIADPYHEDYDREITNKVILLSEKKEVNNE
jgi:hypothetical protein